MVKIPDGYEIDKANSTFERIVFKPRMGLLTMEYVWKKVEKRLSVPDYEGRIYPTAAYAVTCKNKRLASVAAYSALSDIAEYYNKGWVPDWNEGSDKYFIVGGCDEETPYKICSSRRKNLGCVYFKNYCDAKAVIGNPYFRNILDALFKN